MGWGIMDWTAVAQDTDRWLAVMKLRVPLNAEKTEFWGNSYNVSY
jgi:hypothetical protein